MSFPFRTCLNASTLHPFRLNVLEQCKIAGEAGYDGIELWMSDIFDYLENGGSTAELKASADRAGIEFANAIAFFRWADDDPSERETALVQAEQEMRILAAIGCPFVAAPPYGDVERATSRRIGERFAALHRLGRSIGVEPLLEFWGRAKKLSTLSDAREALAESGVAGGKLVLDPFHMHTGGSRMEDLRRIGEDSIGIFHANDYPAEPGRETVTDADRLFPGEGVAPARELAKLLRESGYRGFLSLELFCSDYGGLSALDVAKKGSESIKRAYDV